MITYAVKQMLAELVFFQGINDVFRMITYAVKQMLAEPDPERRKIGFEGERGIIVNQTACHLPSVSLEVCSQSSYNCDGQVVRGLSGNMYRYEFHEAERIK